MSSTPRRISTLEYSGDGRTAFVALPDHVSVEDAEALCQTFGPDRIELHPNSRSWICHRKYTSAQGVSKNSVIIVIATSLINTFKKYFYAWLDRLLDARSRIPRLKTA